MTCARLRRAGAPAAPPRRPRHGHEGADPDHRRVRDRARRHRPLPGLRAHAARPHARRRRAAAALRGGRGRRLHRGGGGPARDRAPPRSTSSRRTCPAGGCSTSAAGSASCSPRRATAAGTVAGVEPSAFASAFARDRLGLDVPHRRTSSTPSLPDASFDAIVLGDVIEHLPDPGAALDRIAALLRPGGVLYLALPDAGSRLARLMGRRWWSVLPDARPVLHARQPGHAAAPPRLRPAAREHRAEDVQRPLLRLAAARLLARAGDVAGPRGPRRAGRPTGGGRRTSATAWRSSPARRR